MAEHLGVIVLLALTGGVLASVYLAWKGPSLFGRIWVGFQTDVRFFHDRIWHAVSDYHNTASSMLGELHAKVDALDRKLAAPAVAPKPDGVILTEGPDEWVAQAAQLTGHSADELERVGNIIRSKQGQALIAQIVVHPH